MPFWWVVAIGLAALFAVVLSLVGAMEPLWVDELHTSWVVSGEFDQLAYRASAGNQSVWYFALVFGLRHCLETLGCSPADGLVSDELALRLPSIIAWSLATVLVGLEMQRASQLNRFFSSTSQSLSRWALFKYHFPALGWCLCMLLDRLQWFYGVEARVYAVLQLFSLAGWLIIASFLSPRGVLDESQSQPWKSRQWFCWRCLGWAAIAAGLMKLHVTSLPSVVAQLCVLCVLAVNRPGIRASLAVVVVLLSAVGLSMADELQPIWTRRMQWRPIGGTADWKSLFSLMPILPMCVPLLFAAVDRLFSLTRGDRILRSKYDRIWLWTVAFAAPLLMAWSLTRLEVAPLFHYRFVITAALPLTIVAGNCLTQIQVVWLRWAALLVSIVWLATSQGTLSYWQSGQLMGRNRNEDWKQAVLHVSERFELNRDSLWCSAGLIEGQSAVPPLGRLENEYLSYPLRGCYQVVTAGIPVQPQALVGKSVYWAKQLGVSQPANATVSQRSDPDPESVAPQFERRPLSDRGIWIVFRGRSAVLEQRLSSAGLDRLPRRYPIVEFGRISCVCLSLR